MARPLTVFALLLSTLGVAQSPDVRIKFDLSPTYRTNGTGLPYFRLFTPLARYSVVGISLITEPGFRVSVVQRLTRIGNEPDASGLDEAYIEDPGIWRVGKQYLPFGGGRLLRESIAAARLETDLFIEGFPIVIAAGDGGAGQPRGVTARIGSRIGASVAYGKHFGIGATSLAPVRRVEDSPGRNRGYGLGFGLDGSRRIGLTEIYGELLVLRDGATLLDVDKIVFEVGANVRLRGPAFIGLSYARDSERPGGLVRLTGAIPLERRIQLEPFMRFDRAGLFDAALTLRIRF